MRVVQISLVPFPARQGGIVSRPASARPGGVLVRLAACFAWWWRRQPRSFRRWSPYGAFVLMYVLSASFYPVARVSLERIDPLVFMAGQMLWLVPPALGLLAWVVSRVVSWGVCWREAWTRGTAGPRHRKRWARGSGWGRGGKRDEAGAWWQDEGWRKVKQGVMLGSGMSLALVLLTEAMVTTSITETALFSCLNGMIVVLVSWLLFRQRVPLLSWLACLCSLASILVFLSLSTMHWMGDLLAFAGGLLLTGNTFLVERFSQSRRAWYPMARGERGTPSPAIKPSALALAVLCGVQWLTMAGEVLLVALLFGNWSAIQIVVPLDLPVSAYVGLITTLLPMATMIVLRPFVNGILLTFLATVEPVAGVVFAFVFAHEHFPPLVYGGALLAIGSLLLQAAASRNTPAGTPAGSLAG